MIRYSTLSLTKKNSLIFILSFASIAIFDSVIVRLSAYTGIEPTAEWGLVILTTFFSIFVVFAMMLLNSVKQIISKYTSKPGVSPLGLRYFDIVMRVEFTLTIAIVLTLILQMIFLNKYSLVLLSALTYLTHLIALFFLSFLVFQFGIWLRSSRRNYIITLYAISFSLLSVNLLVSLLYLDSYFSSSLRPDRSWYPIISMVINHRMSAFTESLSAAFDILSLSSFLVMWIATAILLSQYRHRMGSLRYFSVISIPLIYYLFPFQNYFGGILVSSMIPYPVVFTILYIVVFSATKQVGALLFSLSFWTSSGLLHDIQVRKSILMSSIGMTILFGSLQLTPLQYRVYPPYGLITEALIPLGSYLLLAGIFTGATYISQDAKLRKEFYRSAASQLRLLKGIGISEMERELEKKVKTIGKSPEFLETPKWDLEEEDMKQTLHDVLNEIYSKNENG